MIKVLKITTLILIIVMCMVSYNKASNKLDTKHIQKLDFKKEIKNHQLIQANIDSIIQNTPFNDLLGQLFMVAAFSNKDDAHKQTIAKLISQEKIGGICFFKGSPVKEAILTNYYQSISDIPLFISMDAEWGLAMRLDSTIAFPYQMALGAIQDNNLIQEMGFEIARQCREMGIHINFAPVVDVNNNPKNPVIGFRSFGENKYNVAEKGIAYMQGLQKGNIMACAKHFPGHGDVSVDSHLDLPVIDHSAERIDSLELYPFKQLFVNGCKSTMVAHLSIPSIDNTPNLAGTLSPKIVNELLKKNLGYTGLVFTDALDMKGASKYFKPGEIDAKALLAGNDILLYTEDVVKGKIEIQKAIQEGKITKNEILEKIKKILFAKEEMNIKQNKYINTYNLVNRLNADEAKHLNKKLIEASLTLAKNDNNIIPLHDLGNLNVATLSIGSNNITAFQRQINLYTKNANFNIDKNATAQQWSEIFNKLKKYKTIIIGLHDVSKKPNNNFNYPNAVFDFIRDISKEKNVIVCNFGSPYLLGNVSSAKALVCAYAENKITQELTAQALFGAIAFKGKLPVTANKNLPFGSGFFTTNSNILQYIDPYDIGVNNFYLDKIDSFVQQSIAQRVMPGCQILAAKNGKVFYNKCFGKTKYDTGRDIQPEDIYDVASMTKILASAPILMQMYDEGKIDIDARFAQYATMLEGTDKSDIKVRNVFTHTAGFKSWIPYYKETLTKSGWPDWHYSSSPRDNYNTPVAENLWILDSFKDSIYNKIAASNMNQIGRFVYSDLSFYLWPQYIEKQYGQSFQQITQDFYTNIGANFTGFLPLQRFSPEQIVPSEIDNYFRHQTIQGYVHDMGAAMMGGVSGHAGLFSNANDVAKIMYCYANNGNYNKIQYIQPNTIKTFTSRQSDVCRRGFLFDKPEFDVSKESPTGSLCSYETYGHTGFTGTCTWYDPKNGLLFVFLSNRTYPTMNNNKLNKQNVRTIIHDYLNMAVGYNLY